MSARPPHLLVTTPESAISALNQRKGGVTLRGVETVIVDEIHALGGINEDRIYRLRWNGWHIWARSRCNGSAFPRRSAPIEEIAKFLVGSRDKGNGGVWNGEWGMGAEERQKAEVRSQKAAIHSPFHPLIPLFPARQSPFPTVLSSTPAI